MTAPLVLGPHARPTRPPPSWALIVLGVAIISARLQPTLGGLATVVSLPPAIALAMWLEERAFVALSRRATWVHLLATLVLPIAAIILAAAAAGLVGAIGADPVAPALVLAGFWASSACLGSLVVLLVDGLGRLLASRFSAWIRLTVLGLILTSGLVVVVVAAVVPRALATVITKADGDDVNIVIDGERIPREKLARELAESGLPEALQQMEPGDLLGVAAAFALLVMLVPALISAVSKLGEKAMERIHPLDLAMERVAAGDLAVRVEVGGAIELARLSSRFNTMVEALELGRRLEHAFGAYVSKPVLDRIRAQHGALDLPVVQREATVFFADVRGFTAMSERLPPAQVLEILRRYYRHALEVIGEHEGYVDKFIGDAIYVVFNGPIEQPDHAVRAVRCALQLQARVAQLNADGAFPEIDTLEIGVGVATGPVIAGNMGTERATQFSVVGDTVNLAARLSGLAPATEVWVSANTAAVLPPELPSTPLEPVVVKGKQKPVTPHRV